VALHDGDDDRNQQPGRPQEDTERPQPPVSPDGEPRCPERVPVRVRDGCGQKDERSTRAGLRQARHLTGIEPQVEDLDDVHGAVGQRQHAKGQYRDRSKPRAHPRNEGVGGGHDDGGQEQRRPRPAERCAVTIKESVVGCMDEYHDTRELDDTRLPPRRRG